MLFLLGLLLLGTTGAARARRRRAYGSAAPRFRERGGEAYEGQDAAPRTEGDAAAVAGRRPHHRFRFGH
ncbi:hypothetical protein [Streptomyces vietnamensis]|uniref:Uncharacterized protein n=1 Tax=Streptomyces vietnamensis TaxID=362257 RepID=A0A0B5IF98_9ACTN|nr:hypothetical protein [Streptomyces vietnamensis]AJF68378.1 hypothetical protein SVTN_32575 [Streptomyces vietnamensis]